MGLYTSPHYRDFRERIRISGKEITPREVVDFVQRIDSAISAVKPSFFEITVVMAFDAFARHKVDLAVVETGLGGRLDSTNVIIPELSVITNIDFDHMEMLGNTIGAIAREKAGIIKKGVPVVIGEWNAESAAVFRKVAARKGSDITFANRTLKVDNQIVTADYVACDIMRWDGRPLIPDLRIGASGPYQCSNALTAIQSLQMLGKANGAFATSGEDIRKGMAQIRQLTGYMGRWQVLSTSPLVICDSAHNVQGLTGTIGHLNSLEGHKHMVIGFVREKQLSEIFRLLPADATYYFCSPAVPRGLPVEELFEKAHAAGLKGRKYSSVRRARAAAIKAAGTNDVVFIGGSSFVAAEVV